MKIWVIGEKGPWHHCYKVWSANYQNKFPLTLEKPPNSNEEELKCHTKAKHHVEAKFGETMVIKFQVKHKSCNKAGLKLGYILEYLKQGQDKVWRSKTRTTSTTWLCGYPPNTSQNSRPKH
jgi:hypothetical protein